MKKFHSNSIKALAFTASALAVVIATPAFAQDADKKAEEQAKDEQGEPVVV